MFCFLWTIFLKPAYWIIVALVWKEMKGFLQVPKFIRQSHNWDLSHIIIIVLLECHHTKIIYCMSFFEYREKIDFLCCRTTNVFWPVFISIYVLIRMYYMCIAYYFVWMFMCILMFRFIFLSWLWILDLIAVFFVSNLMYCLMLCQIWRNKQVLYIYIYNNLVFNRTYLLTAKLVGKQFIYTTEPHIEI